LLSLRLSLYLYDNEFKVWCTREAPTPISGFTRATNDGATWQHQAHVVKVTL
jgi:hypothetical protein